MQTYEGTESYIFISYAHKDSKVVIPIIEGLTNANYRVWYDEGIEAGSEWPENVASHITKSEVVLILLSKNALESPNCNREIHFAIKKCKKILVIHLEELELSDGMDMQLSPLQAMFAHKFKTQSDFIEKLCVAKILLPCKNPEVVTKKAPLSKPKKTVNPTKKAAPSEAELTQPHLDDNSLPKTYIEALRCVVLNNRVSIPMIQRTVGIGYPLACRIIEWMEDMDYVSAFDGETARKVLITKEEFEEHYGPLDKNAPPEKVDACYIEALRLIILENTVSISLIQRKFKLGYNKAGLIIEWMEDMGYVTAFDGGNSRKVLITKEQFETLYGPLDKNTPTEKVDACYIEALRLIILKNTVSISLIQRKCKLGYNKAGLIIEWMEEMGYVTAFDGTNPRKVLITKEEFENKYGPL